MFLRHEPIRSLISPCQLLLFFTVTGFSPVFQYRTGFTSVLITLTVICRELWVSYTLQLLEVGLAPTSASFALSLVMNVEVCLFVSPSGADVEVESVL